MIAFFDLDKTVLSINSATRWVRREVAQGHLKKRQALKAAAWLARYHFGFASAESIVADAMAVVNGTDVDTLVERTRVFFREEVRGWYRPGALSAIAEHRAKGDRVVMLTSSTLYLASLVGEELGFDKVLCNVLETRDGRHTGGVIGGVCFGPGKVQHAQRELDATGAKWADALFYTDSFSDLPVLERVARPVAVNPDVRLQRLARARGWPVVDWGSARPS
ncbi:MAG: HAD-IB family hydrolase [Myxococcaceae bacterium]